METLNNAFAYYRNVYKKRRNKIIRPRLHIIETLYITEIRVQQNDVVWRKAPKSNERAREVMEASEEILVESLVNSGVPIPVGFSSIGEFTPAALFSVCFHALRLIDGPHNVSSFPAFLPEDSMPDRVKICTDLAHAFNKLGFNPELSFHKVPLTPCPLIPFFLL